MAWKLTAVLKGQATDTLLATYDSERRTFANTLVETTDRLFTVATTPGDFAGFVRTRITPLLMGAVDRIEDIREFMFRVISQTTLNYHGSALSMGRAGKVEGGDRLPWVLVAGEDNYQPLATIGWQVHVYGEAQPDLEAWCDQHHIVLRVFTWRPEHQKAELARNAVYLLRPDTYIALADPQGSANELARYLAATGLTLH